LDDIPAVAEHPVVQGEQGLSQVWTQTYWGDRAGYEQVAIYRPLVTLSFYLNQQLTPNSSFGFHLLNILLHAGVTLLVWGLFQGWMGRNGAFLGAVIFAVHPVHVDAVAAIANRTELMAALFGMVMLLAYFKGREKTENRGLWGVVILAWVCGVLSKESAVVWPFILLIWEWGERGAGRIRWRGFAAMGGFLLLYLTWRSYILEDPFGGATPWQDNPLHQAEGLSRWGTPFGLIALVIELMVAPFQLSVDYTFNALPLISSWAEPTLWTGLLLFLGVMGVVAYSIREKRLSGIRLGLLVLAIPYGLVSHLLFPGTILFAERLLYLPSVGFILVLAVLMEVYWKRVAVRGLTGLWVVGLCALTWSYSQAWTSPEQLFSTALESRPGSARMHINLGHLALEAQNPDRARKEAERALEIEPTSPEAMVNLGAAFEALGSSREALSWFARGARVLDGTYGLAHINHCRLSVALGELPGAEESCQRSVSLRGDLAAAWGAMGRYLEAVGNLSDAEKSFQTGVSREPMALLPLHELGGFYSRQRRVEKRNEVMMKLLELSPGDAQLRQALVQETRRQLEAAKVQGNENRVQSLGQQLRMLQGLP